jgi:hypothetical protein
VPTNDSKILKVGYTAVIIRESANAMRLSERQRTAPQAFPSVKRPQLLKNVGVRVTSIVPLIALSIQQAERRRATP